MDPLTIARVSAWPVLFCYTSATALRISCRCTSSRRWVRGLWAAGWLLLGLHIYLAWSHFHHSSWNSAYEHTAQRTEAAIGWSWGGGVWLNLLTFLLWGVDLIWLWNQPLGQPGKVSRLDEFCQAYLAFMLFNATVVFGSLPAQVVGVLIACSLAGLAYRRPAQTSLAIIDLP